MSAPPHKNSKSIKFEITQINSAHRESFIEYADKDEVRDKAKKRRNACAYFDIYIRIFDNRKILFYSSFYSSLIYLFIYLFMHRAYNLFLHMYIHTYTFSMIQFGYALRTALRTAWAAEKCSLAVNRCVIIMNKVILWFSSYATFLTYFRFVLSALQLCLWRIYYYCDSYCAGLDWCGSIPSILFFAKANKMITHNAHLHGIF